MNRTDEEQFLIAANTVAAVHDYFHWRVVGTVLKWPEMKSIRTLRSLNEQLLVSLQHGEEARFLPAGRQLAQQLVAQNKQLQDIRQEVTGISRRNCLDACSCLWTFQMRREFHAELSGHRRGDALHCPRLVR